MRAQRHFLLALVALLPVTAAAADLSDLIRNGQRNEALAAIRDGANVNAVQADGSSPLMFAVHSVDLEMVKELLKRGAKPNHANGLRATPLQEAVDTAQVEAVALLLKAGADPDLGNEDDETPLMRAATLGSLPMVEQLVRAGANINAREKYRGQTALMMAIGAGSVPVTEYLIKHGAKVDARAASNDWGSQITSEPRAQYRASGGMTPLLYAARENCQPCAKALLDARADINRPTPDGVTPLMLAIDNGNYDVANFLLDRGANPHLVDWWGRSALYVAVDLRNRGGAMATRGIPIPGAIPPPETGPAPDPTPPQLVRRLLEMGVNPNTQLDMHRPGRGGNTARFGDELLNTGATPLLRAASLADREIVQLLLQHGRGIEVDLPNVMGVTPLMAAAGVGGGGGVGGRGDAQGAALAVIEMLLAAGADVNARITDTTSRTASIARANADRQGQTALFSVVGRGWVRVAKVLLDSGARVDAKDGTGKTVLDAVEAAPAAPAGGRENPAREEMRKLIKSAAGAI
jgi:ankyrin repeat protein